MKSKLKTMRRDEWTNILKKRYISKNNKDYVSGLIIMDEVINPLIVENEYEKIKIIANNYKWLSIAPKYDNYFITAMYDDNDNLIEIYFDITDGNNFDDITNPSFYDMYLDLYITKDKKTGYLDFDDLDEALKNNDININQYNNAKISFEKLSKQLKDNTQNIISLCNQEFLKLKGKI